MSEIPGQNGHALPDLQPPVCAKSGSEPLGTTRSSELAVARCRPCCESIPAVRLQPGSESWSTGGLVVFADAVARHETCLIRKIFGNQQGADGCSITAKG